METKERDTFILMAAQTVGGVLGAVGYVTVQPHWKFLAIVVPLLGATLTAKLLMPRHALLSKVSWPYLILTFGLFSLAAYFGGNHAILGYWTVPSLIGLGFLYCLVHMSLGPGDDGPPVKR